MKARTHWLPQNHFVIAKAVAVFVAYGILTSLVFRIWPTWWALLPVLCCGFILSGFLNAAHDCVHSTHLRPRNINRIVGAAWCTPILVNFTIYKRQHLVHHRYTGVEGDTESHDTFTSVTAYILAHIGWHFWRSLLVRIIKCLRGDFPDSVRTPDDIAQARLDNAVICVWLGCMALLTCAFPKIVLLAYWLPLLAYPPFAVFFSLPEHYGLAGAHHGDNKARNVFSNSLVRFFQWNANFHADHHRAPGVPAALLPEFHRSVSGELTTRSYLEFHVNVLGALTGKRARIDA